MDVTNQWVKLKEQFIRCQIVIFNLLKAKLFGLKMVRVVMFTRYRGRIFVQMSDLCVC